MCVTTQLVSRGLRGRRGVLLASGRYLRLQVPLGAVTCCRVRPSRAVEIRLAMAFASYRSDIWSASLMLGTIRPWGVAAAILRLTYFLTTISWAPRPGRRSAYGRGVSCSGSNADTVLFRARTVARTLSRPSVTSWPTRTHVAEQI